MISGELKTKVDQLRDRFRAGVVSNPMEAIEQITYLMFIHDLDVMDSKREAECRMLNLPFSSMFAGETMLGEEKIPRSWFKWSVFEQFPAEKMYNVVSHGVFPFLKTLHANADSAYAKYMKNALFKIPTPEKLERIVSQMNDIFAYLDAHPEGDVLGDLYEYLLSKIENNGENGQFRTPRHIIDMIVELMKPLPTDTICDPACGTAGFLVSASQYVREHFRSDVLFDNERREHFLNGMFTGYDRDEMMLRIGAMNLLKHGISNPQISYCDSLTEQNADTNRFSLILTNPPFSGNQDDNINPTLTRMVDTGKTELLFLALFVRMLKVGGRCASVVPEGVVSSTNDSAYDTVRRMLVEEQRLEAVISLPSGVFKPYSGVSTDILIFTKTNCGGTDTVWFYRVDADGFSLNDKRTPGKENDLPDVISRFHNLKEEAKRARTEKSFVVPKAEIAAHNYNLSFKTYAERVYERVEYAPVSEILDEIELLEGEITASLKDLREIL